MELRSDIKIYNEDCLPAMKEMADNQYDLAIVDPPYGININNSGRLGHYGGKNKKWDNRPPTMQYFKELYRISKNQIIWGGNYFSLKPTRCFLIWDKKQPFDVSFASCEYGWTSFDKSAKTFYYRPQNMDTKRIHPTQKPIKLYKWLLKNYANEGDKILDTHLGSGSIAIACWDMNYDLTAYELDEDYYHAACKRLKDHQSQIQLF